MNDPLLPGTDMTVQGIQIVKHLADMGVPCSYIGSEGRILVTLSIGGAKKYLNFSHDSEVKDVHNKVIEAYIALYEGYIEEVAGKIKDVRKIIRKLKKKRI